jgi:ubiquinone/menaquinone biosynthesis C-methylase UbiE
MFKEKSINYELFRPNYPKELISFLIRKNILTNNDLIAEFGCGTGKLTELLLKNGNEVHCIEPEKEMHNFTKKKLLKYNKFSISDCSAEKTKLLDNNYNVILAAQSFHLFHPNKAKKQFYRIIKPNGYIVLIWYHWDMNYKTSADIRNLFYKYGKKLNQQKRLEINQNMISNLFHPNNVTYNSIGTIKQQFNRNDFKNSMLSSSYATLSNDKFEYLNEMNAIFDKYSINEMIKYSFNLEAYVIKVVVN